MTFPGGLLDQSAIQRLLASMQGGTQNTVQAPPMGGLMAPQLPEPVPFNPNVDARGRHDHRSGIRGSILHAVGADKVAPELASLLTPDQQARVQPGLMATIGNAVIRGKTPAQVQQERALNMLGLEDTKKARVKRDRDEKMWEQIQGVAAQIPDPQARLEYTARMASSMGLAQGGPTAEAADRLRPPQMQLRANAKMTVLGNDGNYYAIQQDPMGNEVPGSRVRVPKPTAGITYREGVGPDGQPVYMALPAEEGGDARGSVAPRSTGVVVPTDPSDARAATAAAERRANDARMLTDDLAGVNEALAQLQKNPDAFGLENVLPGVLRNRLPGAADDATTIGSLEYVVGRLRHDRFGGALSALEADKAARIFSEPKNPAPVIRAQLEVIKKALARQAESIRQQQETQATPAPAAGGKTITVNGKTFRIP